GLEIASLAQRGDGGVKKVRVGVDDGVEVAVGRDDRRKVGQPAAPGLVVVRLPQRVEVLIAEGDVVGAHRLRREEIGSLRGEVLVVPALGAADTAENRGEELAVAVCYAEAG